MAWRPIGFTALRPFIGLSRRRTNGFSAVGRLLVRQAEGAGHQKLRFAGHG